MKIKIKQSAPGQWIIQTIAQDAVQSGRTVYFENESAVAAAWDRYPDGIITLDDGQIEHQIPNKNDIDEALQSFGQKQVDTENFRNYFHAKGYSGEASYQAINAAVHTGYVTISGTPSIPRDSFR